MNPSNNTQTANPCAPVFPVTYGKSHVASLLYLVNADRAEQRLATTGMVPVTLGNQALLSVTWFDYESSALGPYRELSIGIVTDSQRELLSAATHALLGRFLTLGTFVVALPVTSPLAQSEGIERLGLPKTLMELPLTWSKGFLDATALANSKRVLSMRIPLGLGPKIQIPTLVIYSQHHGELLRTKVTTKFKPQIDWVGRPRLQLEDREHPLSLEFVHFELETATCVGIIHGPMTSAKLLAPEVVGSVARQ